MAKLKVHDIAPEKLKTLTKAVMATDKGDITIEFYPDVAPNTVANFYTLAGAASMTASPSSTGFVASKDRRSGGGTRRSTRARRATRTSTWKARFPWPIAAATGGSQFFLVLEPQPHRRQPHGLRPGGRGPGRAR